MTDALSLDLDTVAAQCAEAKPPRDPWLQRRDHTWGASDVPALLLAYDPRPDELATARKYHMEDAETGRYGFPRIVARKAGLSSAKRVSSAMQLGTDRESELLALWAERAGMERVYKPEPRCCLPYVDRLCGVLAVTPDHFALDDFGLDVTVEAKCTFDRADRGPHWFWDAQVQAQIATCAVSYGVVVVGPGWARDAELRDAPVAHVVMPDAQEQTRIRRVLSRAWEDVLKANGKEGFVMNVTPKEFYKRAAEERAEEEANDERRETVARAERTKCGYPRPPNCSVSFAKKLKGGR